MYSQSFVMYIQDLVMYTQSNRLCSRKKAAQDRSNCQSTEYYPQCNYCTYIQIYRIYIKIYRIYITRYRTYITRYLKIPHKISNIHVHHKISNINHKTIEYTS